MNFKSILSAAAITLAGVAGVAQPAQARECFDFMNGYLCNSRIASADTYLTQTYVVDFSNGTLRESFTIVCNGRNFVEFTSKGNMTQAQADYFSREFCALPN